MADGHFEFTAEIGDDQVRRIADIIGDQANRLNGMHMDPMAMYKQIDELLSLTRSSDRLTLLLYIARRHDELMDVDEGGNRG